ncbi:LacI family transcriptional regulator [Hanstruepera neustonica]|uniref:LacI family transcriptional regulator n=1 Tax=Hanstruepera neustonica TaxID=1445657 RepID=A0A2K1E334_9FLAO|nr:LacI family DNA-binding transcriptional regulator [Hanstruepera neustonica]PNQ74675.1 LacI family transcriptional regulator [Hanstruepera neustonica]
MVTLKQLAQELNVSVSTVSKALNNSDEIGAETIERVKELAQLYNYKPNQLALNLKRSATKTIGVIIPNILNHFFAQVLFGIEKEASKKGYNIITCLSNESNEKEIKSLEVLSHGSVDGFIVSVAEETQTNDSKEHFENLVKQNIPIVMFDRVLNDVGCMQVIINDYESSYTTTKHLLNEGRKKIALLSNISELSVGKLRIKGYLDALSESKHYTNDPIVASYDLDDDNEEKIESLLMQNMDIDGVIAIDNTSGVIALHKALKSGKQVPKNISIIGFSGNNILPFSEPKLSTVSQHPLKIGSTTVNMLIDSLEKRESKKRKVLIKTELILRGTTL